MECKSNNNDSYVNVILDEPLHHSVETMCSPTLDGDQESSEVKSSSMENTEKNSAVWTTSATSTLLKLYESELQMLETPKKKTRIWIAISENLKDYNINMSPDQVRWKINALSQKYKQCIDRGLHGKFKYFKEMESIYGQYNVDCDSYTIVELMQKKKNNPSSALIKPIETKAMIEVRKLRLANRMEADRSQSKIHMEKQWLEYLRREEEHKVWRDEINERTMKLKEEELELCRRELELKETLEVKKIQLMEKEHKELLHLEREKCELLKQLLLGYN